MHAELDALQDFLRENIREVRRSIFALRPVTLDELGFFPALRQFLTDFGEQNQLQIDLSLDGPPEALPVSLELALFRIIQEALNNVAKHARAQVVWIDLSLSAAAGVTLKIRDDGQGFETGMLEAEVRRGRVGLKQMAERVEQRGGGLTVQSQVGRGTTILVTWPRQKS